MYYSINIRREKNIMKDKILYLIIGILIGGIIATSAFLIYHKTLEYRLLLS